MSGVYLEELAEWGQQLIESLGWRDGQSRRVRWNLTPRLLRYYTTLGLLDRATRFEGRTALYGEKHLLQALAIKWLQLQGQTLEQIQQRLLGQTPTQLAQWLGLSLPLDRQQSAATPAAFWERRPCAAPELWRTAPVELVSLGPGLQLLIDRAALPAHLVVEDLLPKIAELYYSVDRTGKG